MCDGNIVVVVDRIRFFQFVCHTKDILNALFSSCFSLTIYEFSPFGSWSSYVDS